MKLQVLSVKENNFTDKATGEARQMWQLYCADELGAVGSIYSAQAVKTGEPIEVKLLVNRDGRFAPKIIHPKSNGQIPAKG